MRVLLYPLFRLNVDYLRSGNYKYLIKYMVVTCTKGNMTPTELDLMTPIKSSVAHSYSLSLYYSYILYHSSHACTRSVQIVYILQLQSKISRLPDAIDQQMTLLQFNSGELLGDGRS